MSRSQFEVVARVCLSLMAGALVTGVHAASVGSSGYSADFSTQPAAVDWSTYSIGGGAADIADSGGMDAAVQGIAASVVNAQVTADLADPAPIAGTEERYGPFKTEREADQTWRARMADKLDICNHRLRVFQRES